MINRPSEQLTDFLNLLSSAQSHYNFCLEQMKEQDKLTQDYLHSLELDELKCNERSKLATKLKMNRKDRRYYKDRVEELEPIVEWMQESANVKAINMLKQVLGKVRKAEGYHENRIYVPRVIKEKEE